MLVFSVETSCDETSICLMKNKRIIEHLIYSQEIHNNFGGVVPELASRSHLEILQKMTKTLFNKNSINPKNIDIFTATCGPGLIGSLLVGSTFAKSLSISCKKPFVPMNHLEGHILSTSFNNDIKYPQIILLLTGGHTQIYIMKNEKSVNLIGESIDDAIGEAFDKTAKILGLPYPGGSEIEKKAKNGDENYFKFPKPLTKENNFNFSFSGIKTHVNMLTKKNNVDNKFIENLSASFQKCISEILNIKINKVLSSLKNKNINVRSVSVVGGVANNKYIKNTIERNLLNKDLEVFYPLKEMMSDNAAMIAWACIKNYNNTKNNVFFKAAAKINVNSNL